MTAEGGAAPLIDTREIMELLPHRPPILLVDRVLEMDEAHIVGAKTVSGDEPWFAGHFPNRPVMPGVLIVEGLAQVGGIFVIRQHPPEGEGWVPNLTGVDRVRFRRPVLPGDELRYELAPLRQRVARRLSLWRFAARALVGGKVVCDATISAALVREGGDA